MFITIIIVVIIIIKNKEKMKNIKSNQFYK